MESTTLTEADTQEAAELAEALNEQLRAAGAGNAEQAFGISFGLGILPLVAIVVALYIFKVVNLILAIILLGMALMALMGISTLVAIRARVNTTKRFYRFQVEPEVAQFLSRKRISRQQFDTLVYPLLSEGAPLRAILAPLLPEEGLQGDNSVFQKELK